MPPLTLFDEMPHGTYLFLIWLGVNATLAFLLKLLGPNTQLIEHVGKTVIFRLPSINEEIWRMVNDAKGSRYEGPLCSPDYLSKLYKRIRKIDLPTIYLERLRRGIAFCVIALICSSVAAVVLGGLYWWRYPAITEIRVISIVIAVIFSFCFLSIFGSSIFYFFQIWRYKNDDE
jgi:hypothetical protein